MTNLDESQIQEAEERKKLRKKRTAWNIAINIVVFGMLAIIVFMVAFVMITQSKNRIAYVFGYSIALIQTGSMIDGGFDIGERVIIKTPDVDGLRVNDIIVFYKYQDNVDVNLPKTDVSQTIDTYVPPEYDEAEKKALEDKRDKLTDEITTNSLLIFHRITGIYVDEYGTLFFQTKGDSNATADSILVREDFVAGQYIEAAPFFNWLLEVFSSFWGIVILVLIPLLLLTISQAGDLIRGITGALSARNLINGKTYFRDKKYEKFNANKFFEEEEKLYLYFITSEEDKADIASFLWKNNTNPETQENSEILPSDLLKCFELKETTSNEFWGFWKERNYSESFVKRINLMEKVFEVSKEKNIPYLEALEEAKQRLRVEIKK